jgi:hypothetical protein
MQIIGSLLATSRLSTDQPPSMTGAGATQAIRQAILAAWKSATRAVRGSAVRSCEGRLCVRRISGRTGHFEMAKSLTWESLDRSIPSFKYQAHGPAKLVAWSAFWSNALVIRCRFDHLAALIPPPRRHRHRHICVLAQNAPLRAAVTAFVRTGRVPTYLIWQSPWHPFSDNRLFLLAIPALRPFPASHLDKPSIDPQGVLRVHAYF